MGGVDRTDQNVDRYRNAIRSKKCLWPIFVFIAWIVAFSNRLTQEALNKINDLLSISVPGD